MSHPVYAALAPEVVAILRGITPNEIERHCEVLIDAGIRAIEVPLNSPDPFRSIKLAVRKAGEVQRENGILVGAGTVVAVDQVKELHDLGASLVVSPNADQDLIQETVSRKMVSLPGFLTPTEAFQAIEAGASALKLFPSNIIGPAGLAAMKAVLPQNIDVLVVGGVGADNFEPFRKAGAAGLGVGSSLYRPGQAVEETRQRASEVLDAVKLDAPL